jgi:hypothetical protein
MNIPKDILALRAPGSTVGMICTGGGFDFLYRNFGRFELVISPPQYDIFYSGDGAETPAIVTRFEKGADVPDDDKGDWMNPETVFEGTALEAVRYVESLQP